MSDSRTVHVGGDAGLIDRATQAADLGLERVVASERWVRLLAGGARYAVAGVLSAVAYPVLAVVLHLGLLAVALVADLDVGGPLALPWMVLLGAVVGLVATVVALVACAVVEAAAARRATRRALLLVRTVAVHVLLVTGVALLVASTGSGWPGDAATTVLVAFAVAAPALVITLVVVHGAGALTSWGLRLARRRVEGRASTSTP